MSRWAGQQKLVTLWQSNWTWKTHAGLDGATDNLSWNIPLAIHRTIFAIQQMGHTQLAEVAVGKG